MSAERINTFDDIFQIGLQYAYDAERQLAEAMPKVAEVAASPQLRLILEEHLHETQVQMQRVEKACSMLGITPGSKTNNVMSAMVQEVQGMIASGEPSPLLDAALIYAANQIEHFEIATYGSLRTYAGLIGQDEIASLMDKTLLEEQRANDRLTQLAESDVNKQAAQRRGQQVA